jgi:predicted metal-binding membrane protein
MTRNLIDLVHPTAPASWRRIAWHYPQWWTIGISVSAWAALFALPRHGVHSGNDAHRAFSAAAPGIGADAIAWMLMVAAMMFPLILGPIEVTAARSLWKRRHRAIAGFLIGYATCWLIPGVAAALLLAQVRPHGMLPSPTAAAAALVIAGLWQGTAIRGRAVRACHRTMPLAPVGWRADRDCLRYGWTTARSCIVSCGPMMIACALGGHGAFTAAAAGSIGLVERHAVRPDQRSLGLALGALAAAQFVAA